MMLLILTFLCIVVAIFGPAWVQGAINIINIKGRAPDGFVWAIRSIFGFFAMLCFFFLSVVTVDQYETGHLHKIYGAKNLAAGAIIAVHGEKGPQAKTLAPGFHFILFVRLVYRVTTEPVVVIPDGRYGYLVAQDGKPLRPDQTYADAFSPEDGLRMTTDTEYFLTHGGQRGPQTSVLTPGTYRLNRFLWDVTLGEVTQVSKGFVAVIKSNSCVARGRSPFQLAFGNASAMSATSSLQSLISNTAAQIRVGNATAASLKELGDPDRLVAKRELPWKAWLLWAALIIAVGILAAVAYRLSREMSEKDRPSN